jgi:hypothetical protein
MMLASMAEMLHYNLCLKEKSKLCFGVRIDMSSVISAPRSVD